MDTAVSTIRLEHRFQSDLPELGRPWQAASVGEPRLLVLNDALAVELGLDPDFLRTDAGVRFLVGGDLPAGAQPVAQAYAGHQFGGYSPLLGDGRALLLGELRDTSGRLRDLGLKGSGPTPFARGGDGFAAVGPMLREYLIGEAMHALGIPTTRALAVIATGDDVYREEVLPGAVLVRVAASHLRVGSFQLARASGDAGILTRLADHARARHAPDVDDALSLFRRVVRVQAELIARWMLVGFIHGVMNTDNMTISGETIDYGPCAFLDGFDPATVYSSIDLGGRYAYGAQPHIGEWNLARLAEAMLPLFAADSDEEVALAQDALAGYRPAYWAAWSTGLRAKLGLAEDLPDGTLIPLVDDMHALLHADRADYTSFFRALADAARGSDAGVRMMLPSAGDRLTEWLSRWRALEPDATAMDLVNPRYIPRNLAVQAALDAASAGDMAPFERAVRVLSDPYTLQADAAEFAVPPPGGDDGFRTYCGT